MGDQGPADLEAGGIDIAIVTRNHWTWRRESTDAAETEKPKESEDSEDSYETDETEDQAEDQAERVLFPPGSQIKLGYPLQSAFQSSKPTFSIYRAFDYLHSRVILELQDQLRELEAELGKLDKKHSKSKDIKQNARVISRMRDLEVAKLAQDSGTTDDMSEPSVHVGPTEQPSRKVFRSRRAMLLEEIQQKLVRYDETLANARRLNEFQRPSDRDRLNLQRWLGNERPVNFKPEEDFIRFKYDLITLNPRSDSGKIDAWIENAIGKLPIGMTSYFYKQSFRGFENEYTHFFHVDRIERLAVLIIASVIILLLAVPMFIMYRLTLLETDSSTLFNIALMIGFALLFSLAMGRLTKAKRAELFAATAGYCAVLTVFIGGVSVKVNG